MLLETSFELCKLVASKHTSITKALEVAQGSDYLIILPGTFTEDITMKKSVNIFTFLHMRIAFDTAYIYWGGMKTDLVSNDIVSAIDGDISKKQ